MKQKSIFLCQREPIRPPAGRAADRLRAGQLAAAGRRRPRPGAAFRLPAAGQQTARLLAG